MPYTIGEGSQIINVDINPDCHVLSQMGKLIKVALFLLATFSYSTATWNIKRPQKMPYTMGEGSQIINVDINPDCHVLSQMGETDKSGSFPVSNILR